jgi:hypothetical protein
VTDFLVDLNPRLSIFQTFLDFYNEYFKGITFNREIGKCKIAHAETFNFVMFKMRD